MANKASIFFFSILFFLPYLNSKAENAVDSRVQVEVGKSISCLPSNGNVNCPLTLTRDDPLNNFRSPGLQDLQAEEKNAIKIVTADSHYLDPRWTNGTEAVFSEDRAISARFSEARAPEGLMWWMVKSGFKWILSYVGAWMFGPWFTYAVFAFNAMSFMYKFMSGYGYG